MHWKHITDTILSVDRLFEAARMLLLTCDHGLCLVQCIMCASVRKMQRNQGNPCPTDVELFLAVPAWSATHRAVIERSSRHTYPLLQEHWFWCHPTGIGCGFVTRDRFAGRGHNLDRLHSSIHDMITFARGTGCVGTHWQQRELEKCCCMCGALLLCIRCQGTQLHKISQK